MHTAGRSTMHGMSWSGFVTGAVDACMMSLLLRAWWAARPEAASAGTPLGQDGRPSTCAISGPRRPPRTFDTPNCTVSSVPIGWWRSGAANWKTPVDFFYSDMKPGVFMVPRAAGSLLKKLPNVYYTRRVRDETGPTRPGRNCGPRRIIESRFSFYCCLVIQVYVIFR